MNIEAQDVKEGNEPNIVYDAYKLSLENENIYEDLILKPWAVLGANNGLHLNNIKISWVSKDNKRLFKNKLVENCEKKNEGNATNGGKRKKQTKNHPNGLGWRAISNNACYYNGNIKYFTYTNYDF